MARKTSERPPVGAHLASLQDAAAEMAVSVKTLRRRISDGTLHAYRIGRLIRVDVDEMRRDLLITIPTAR